MERPHRDLGRVSAEQLTPSKVQLTVQGRASCSCYWTDHLLTAVPPKRRGRRYKDRLLDNIEADQPADKQALRNPRADPRRQVDKQPAATSSRPSLPISNTPGDKAEEGIGWGEGVVPDDWGWGLENPTLAAATGSYESELQAQQGAYGKQNSDEWSGAVGESDLNVSEPQLEADWDDEEEATADDETADNGADVTLLDSREVVRQLDHPATRQALVL